MRYGSVCSGMEAATAAWHPYGWQPQFFSEIDNTAARFLAAKYPDIPNLGDMTKFKEWPDYDLDLLVGGTPCQSFSVAGLRKGLEDPRGNLMLTYLGVADRYKPKWLVWENVPGVLSSGGGRDFGSFLGALAELGYGWAYRVMDAQFVRVESHRRAVPQRRRRVFVVGCLGDWRRAAAVLFERESLSGHPPPRRETGKGTARGIEIGPSGGGFTDVNPTLDCRAKDGPIRNQLAGAVICSDVSPVLRAGGNQTGGDRPPSTDVDTVETLVAHSLRSRGFDASEDGTGRGTPVACAVADSLTVGANQTFGFEGEICAIQRAATRENPSSGPDGIGVRSDGAAYTLEARQEVQAVAFAQNTRDEVRLIGGDGQSVGALAADSEMKQTNYIATQWAVRRLTPLECTRLQGFPDDYFDVPGKPFADGAKYKMLGNSMAVNVMSWVGQRIAIEDMME